MAHQILEANRGADGLVLLGIPTRGVALAERLAREIVRIEGSDLPVGALDITMYRDDLRRQPTRAVGRTHLPVEVDDRVVVLVDDVLYSGRTVRAALDALGDVGRPRTVRLAVLVDRGHRELPIQPDHVGADLPTRPGERVRVRLARGRRRRGLRGRAVRRRGDLMRHLLSAADLDLDEITTILDLAEEMALVQTRPVKKLPALRGRTVVNLFFEDSTRTRSSFELAGKWLSADVINVSAKGSSVSKGESLRDTVLTVASMGVDALVIRHHASGAPWQASQWIDCHVLNAGDGTHEHPTQALLDAFTMRRHLRIAEPGLTDFAGKTVAVVGDITHSRVARSNVLLLQTLGARVILVAPPTLLPSGVDSWPAEVSTDFDAVIGRADVVMMLRVQRERMSGGYFPTPREYTVGYGLTRSRLAAMKPGAAICHPGPMNRGLEISADAADASNSLILDQVAAGVAVRMSVLYQLLGGGE